jgi:hypothetical protein
MSGKGFSRVPWLIFVLATVLFTIAITITITLIALPILFSAYYTYNM